MDTEFFDFFNKKSTASKEIQPQSKKQNIKSLKKNSSCRFKIGDLIVIKRLENSMYNYYKGYIGEVKKIYGESDHMLIILEAINEYKILNIPITHCSFYN